MRPPDPEMTAMLEAIDATLAGEAVEPEHADVAELALLLRAERHEPAPQFVARLDDRAAHRFGADPPRRRASTRWLFVPAAGLAVALVIAIVIAAGHHPTPGPSAAASSSHARRLSPSTAASPATASGALAPSSASAVPVQPPANGRKVVQSSQLSLSASGDRIDDVAQEVFDVIGAEHGYVDNSTVTASGGPSGYAQFQLTVPSDVLGLTMTQLSELRYASVVSRTDISNDVTNQWASASNQLSQARALRTSLLKQLDSAVTQTQIGAIKAQLADADAKISGAQGTLRSLGRQVSNSQISLTVNERVVPVAHGSGGFTLGKAAHDAGRVLEVVAGVALIALAVLLPVGLLAALGWWVAAALRRRRREQALDLA